MGGWQIAGKVVENIGKDVGRGVEDKGKAFNSMARATGANVSAPEIKTGALDDRRLKSGGAPFIDVKTAWEDKSDPPIDAGGPAKAFSAPSPTAAGSGLVDPPIDTRRHNQSRMSTGQWGRGSRK